MSISDKILLVTADHDGGLSEREEGQIVMNGDTTADVRNLIERLRQGDESARKALLERVYHRLCRVAAASFHKEFPRLRGRHDLGSVVDEAWMRLTKALEKTQPASAEEFYGLMFHKVRHVLLDMARRQTRDDRFAPQGTPNAGRSDTATPYDVEESTHDPARLAFWTEFHREVESLPANQRIVFDFHYFAEFPQAEIARLMDLPPKQVSRLWLAATGQLAQRLGRPEDWI